MVNVSPDAMTPSNTPPNTRITWVEKSSQFLTSTAFSIMQAMYKTTNGLTPTIACTCVSTANLCTLTPFPISPQFKNYYSYMSFAFVADRTSTGLLTATLVPTTGSTPTLKIMKADGASQATTGDIVINLFYILYYVDTLDSGNGAFVLK